MLLLRKRNFRNGPKGHVRIFRDGVLAFETDNVVVNNAAVAIAQCAAGFAQYAVSAGGYGNGTTPPAITDTGLSGGSVYFNTITTWTFPSSGSLGLTFQLSSSDASANGLVVNEIGLFSNPTPVVLPVTTQPGLMWAHALASGFTFSDTGYVYVFAWILTF